MMGGKTLITVRFIRGRTQIRRKFSLSLTGRIGVNGTRG